MKTENYNLNSKIKKSFATPMQYHAFDFYCKYSFLRSVINISLYKR